MQRLEWIEPGDKTTVFCLFCNQTYETTVPPYDKQALIDEINARGIIYKAAETFTLTCETSGCQKRITATLQRVVEVPED